MYVEPAEGDLPPVDREYYVMQSEFYHEHNKIKDNGKPSPIVEFSYPNALREEPSVVVFNGHETALIQEKTLKALVYTPPELKAHPESRNYETVD